MTSASRRLPAVAVPAGNRSCIVSAQVEIDVSECVSSKRSPCPLPPLQGGGTKPNKDAGAIKLLQLIKREMRRPPGQRCLIFILLGLLHRNCPLLFAALIKDLPWDTYIIAQINWLPVRAGDASLNARLGLPASSLFPPLPHRRWALALPIRPLWDSRHVSHVRSQNILLTGDPQAKEPRH